MSLGVRGGVVAVILALAVAGCSETPTVTRSSRPPGTPAASSTAPAPSSTADLAALKRSAGIADCPASDTQVVPVAGELPDVVLPCLGGGRPVRLAGLRGRPMIINIWAQWCPPCRQEAPFLSEVAGADTSDLVILGVDHDDPRPELALEFARLASWRYPQLQDPDRQLRTTLQVTGLPQTLFVRADGSIAYRERLAFSSAAQIRDLAEQHLGVRP